MKPHVICHMITSLDGGLHPSRFTKSPDGSRSEWSSAYEEIHKAFGADAWIVGRVTMAEISKATAHPPADVPTAHRPLFLGNREARSFAVGLDRGGKLHFNGGEIDGDHVIVLPGKDVQDSHLAELAADGVSYFVSDGEEIDLAAALDMLGSAFGIRTLLLEGGAGINGSFFAAGLVDELSLLVTPALDARDGADRVVVFGKEGLAGKCELSLTGSERLEHGLMHLRYAVTAPAG